jgi:DUF1365 family protein
MKSCLYECAVFHRRLAPKQHEFLYRVFYFCLDLDEIDQARTVEFPRWPLLGFHRPAVFCFYSRDHFGKKSRRPLRPQVEAFLGEHGLPRPARIRFLTNLRIFGYVFNPIAIYFCEDAEGRPLAAVTQVGNTFGEQKLYLVSPRPARSSDAADPSDVATEPVGQTPRASDYASRLAKEFYVSPFSDLDLDFDFRFSSPGDHLRVAVDEFRGEEKLLLSTLTGKRRDLTTGRLIWFLLKYPLLTLQVIFLIHWQAWRIYRKGLAFRRKEAELEKQTGILNPRDSPRDSA